ncbi:uncharacterized protein LOC130233362 [Danio aesculapii]|uniref:uncharacterized protein LOC130233362 n=1 Tax=Danio aesculapii TaxID=1142201 RepID=UPI0024BFACFF|nr:uncharacterized protein LOC130233362 [Danio aesculapii]XP_056319344.1 uncharacterized protein LOC130233362 [Danio aesculapii]
MSLACLSLSAGEASMEALELELEAVESQIRSLETKREGIRALLLTRTRSSEVSVRYNDNLPVSSTPRVSLSRPSAPRTRCTQVLFTPTPGYHGPRVQPRKVLARSRGRTSPPPVFEIPTENRFAPLRETGRDVAIIGDSIVRHVRSTSSKGNKVRTFCFPGARVKNISAQIPTILSAAESLGAAVLHVGTNDTGLRQTEILKKDFRSLIETVRRTSPATQIIVSGPLPTYRRGNERFSRLFALNEWLLTWCEEQKLLFANNWNLFWERPRLFRADGLHPSRAGAELLSDNITRILRSI